MALESRSAFDLYTPSSLRWLSRIRCTMQLRRSAGFASRLTWPSLSSRSNMTVMPPTSPEELHGFRVETKQFRYALELFQSVYGIPLERKLESLRDIQKLLYTQLASS
jgi:CHAD domain-containing protein